MVMSLFQHRIIQTRQIWGLLNFWKYPRASMSTQPVSNSIPPMYDQIFSRAIIQAIWIWRFIGRLNFVVTIYFNNVKKNMRIFNSHVGYKILRSHREPRGIFHSIGYRATVYVEHCLSTGPVTTQHVIAQHCVDPWEALSDFGNEWGRFIGPGSSNNHLWNVVLRYSGFGLSLLQHVRVITGSQSITSRQIPTGKCGYEWLLWLDCVEIERHIMQ